MVADPAIDAHLDLRAQLHAPRGDGGDRRRPSNPARASWSAWRARSRWDATSPRPGGCWSWSSARDCSTATWRTSCSRPAVVRGQDIVWSRGAALTGPPYLARAAEEHSGPHMPWFWDGELQGGGVLNDMMCHSVEVARFLLTPPGAPRDVLDAGQGDGSHQLPEVAAAAVRGAAGRHERWQARLRESAGRGLRARRWWSTATADGSPRIVETTTSWCYVGAGLAAQHGAARSRVLDGDQLARPGPQGVPQP